MSLWLKGRNCPWPLARIKDHVELINGWPFDSSGFNPQDGTPVIRIRNLLRGTTETFHNGEVPEEVMVRDGDLVIGMDGDFNSVVWQGGPAALNQRLCLVRANQTVDQRFLAYFIGIPLRAINDVTFFTTVKHLSSVDVLNERMPMPPIEIQRNIAEFLDRETERIDAMIDKKRRLIDLLEEKRTATITHAVTKGLDPTAPMKDSGIPWIGQFPAHWSVKKLLWFVRIAEGQVDPRVEPFASMKLIAPNHIVPRVGDLLDVTSARDQAAISGKYLCEPGDVIYSKIRPALRKAVVASERSLCSADMYPMSVRAGLDTDFLKWLLLSDSFSEWAMLESDRVAMPKINRESLESVRVALPPQHEQSEIAAFLGWHARSVRRVVGGLERQLALLAEYREALITAAVTGEIDVDKFDGERQLEGTMT